MRIIFVLLVIGALTACHQLIPGDVIENDDGNNAPEFTLFEPGDSANFKLHYAEENSLYLELSGLKSPGIYSLHFIPRLEDLYNIYIIAQLYDNNSCIGDGDYLQCYKGYRDEYNRLHYEILFELKDTESRYAKIYLEYERDDNCVYNISFRFNHVPFDDPFPDYYSNREITLGTTLPGCFSRLMQRPSDTFILSGLNENTIYSVSVDYDYTNSVFTLNNSNENYMTLYSSSTFTVVASFRTRDRETSFFTIWGGNVLVFEVWGYTGTSYEITAQTETKTFTPDIFEPDNGPVSGSMETITDTGWIQYQGESHTLINSETDWISFLPSTGCTYKIYIILEDTWYDSEIEEDFDVHLIATSIKPNGYESEKSTHYDFTRIPDTPVKSFDYLSWANSGEVTNPWFIKINNAESRPCLQYSLQIEKIN
ncbi:MAG: hypothetical protein JXB88_13955 [Spirochaetales bacterium]|nr:hypothetical protein [Spirochaetales bacterium]